MEQNEQKENTTKNETLRRSEEELQSKMHQSDVCNLQGADEVLEGCKHRDGTFCVPMEGLETVMKYLGYDQA